MTAMLVSDLFGTMSYEFNLRELIEPVVASFDEPML